MDPLSLLWIFFILASLQPALQRQYLVVQRRRRLEDISQKRNATVITLIHRQETMSLFGFPLVRYIDIDDSEGVLRAIRDSPADRAIALRDHQGKVSAVVPHYAMSGGTLIALAADEIVVDSHAVLGPVDPQLGQYPAASILAAVEHPQRHDDQTLILADVARKAIVQVESFTCRMLEPRLGAEKARSVARVLATGTWTHDHPLQIEELQLLGLPVSVGIGDEERELMTLYPQPRGRQPAVEYAPGAPERPTLPSRREMPRPARSERG